MDARVHGKNMQVDDGVRQLAEDKVRHAGRIFDDGGSADVEFTERHNPRISDGRYRVEITTHMKGHTVRVEAAEADDRAALDVAVDKFERQLRRLKERLIQRNRQRIPAPPPLFDDPPISDAGPGGTVATETGDDGERVVVRTKSFEMRPMSVEEASLQMEMLGHDFFFFFDADLGTHSVLYHRKDGTLGLIQPS